MDLGALLIAAEASRGDGSKRYRVEEYEEAATRLSRDSSLFLDSLTAHGAMTPPGGAWPSMALSIGGDGAGAPGSAVGKRPFGGVGVDDRLWTAFLAGKLDDVRAEIMKGNNTFPWMEPSCNATTRSTSPTGSGRPSSAGTGSSVATLSGGGYGGSTGGGMNHGMGSTARSGSREFGVDFGENPESVQLFMGLGGVMPERRHTHHGQKPKALRRVIESGY
ncbi:hypothetical protein HK101_004799 [Irineochytrium annulatum]|nr:hypothetical protein HK101_004799 [Irineochytrium annulatum]